MAETAAGGEYSLGAALGSGEPLPRSGAAPQIPTWAVVRALTPEEAVYFGFVIALGLSALLRGAPKSTPQHIIGGAPLPSVFQWRYVDGRAAMLPRSSLLCAALLVVMADGHPVPLQLQTILQTHRLVPRSRVSLSGLLASAARGHRFARRAPMREPDLAVLSHLLTHRAVLPRSCSESR